MGEAKNLPHFYMTILERLESKTTKIENGCWLWDGTRSSHSKTSSGGYGQIHYEGRTEYVHRVAAHLFLGLNLSSQIQQANHQTFCPNKNCWNPEHLYIGTHGSNMRDRGTNQNTNKTHCKNGHEFSKKNTRYDTRGNRICKICNREWQRNESTERN